MTAFRVILDVMMARQLAAAMIAVALGAACGKALNPAYCDDHPNDVDCRNSGMVAIDAPMGECTSSAMCASNPNGNVCDVLSQTCVQCIVGVDVNACTANPNTPQCGADHMCHGCILDAHCAASGVCLPNGMCADEASVLYARPGGTGTTCTKTDRCTFTGAIAAVTTTKKIVKLTVDMGVTYSERPLTLNVPAVQILGPSAKFQPSEDGNAISVTDGNVEIVGLEVLGATGTGVTCSGTGVTLTLRAMRIHNHGEYGVTTTGCTVTMERSRLSSNPLGAMLLEAGTLEIRNNIIDKNGSGTLENGNVAIRNSSGRFVFNTLAENDSKGGSDRVGGIDCTPANGLTMLVARNLLADYGSGTAFRGNCTISNMMGPMNYTTTDVDNAQFANLTDYKLTDESPTTILRDDPDSVLDCMIGSPARYIDDYEGEIRPFGFCDRGADEYKP
ncbi:MAG TPA: hypothetical protein VIV11_31595 [Kofleriaceae bacterium]